MMTSGAPNASSATIASSRPSAVATRQPQRVKRTRSPSSTRGSLSMASTLSPAERLPRRDRLGRARLRAGLKGRPSERRGDEEHRPLARAGAQPYGMLKHPSQTLDDRQAKPKAARHACALVEPLELSEDRALMLGRNAEAGIPDLDADRAGNSAATDQHPAAQRIFERVRNQVLQQPPHEAPIGANGERGGHEDEIEPLRPGEGGKLDLEQPHEIGDRNVGNLRARRAGVES